MSHYDFFLLILAGLTGVGLADLLIRKTYEKNH
jgi:hypothetical protein